MASRSAIGFRLGRDLNSGVWPLGDSPSIEVQIAAGMPEGHYAMLAKRAADLTFTDIEQLALDKVAESRTLEFKQAVAGASDEAKKEFLADVSAFANANGGDLVYGVAEDAGTAESVPGLELPDPDAEKRRLGDLIRSGLEPKLVNFDIEWLPSGGSKGVMVVRVPRSWSMPHRVTLRGHDKFYMRNSTGKHPMNVDELRSAFNLSQTVFDRLERFRGERLNKIASDQGSIAVPKGAKVVFHVLPLISFAESLDIRVGDYTGVILPLGGYGGHHRYTSEGFALCSGQIDFETAPQAYSMIFRSGVIECVASIGYEKEHGKMVQLRAIERDLEKIFPSCLYLLNQQGIEPPVVLSLSLVDIAGHRAAMRPEAGVLSYPCRQESVIFDEQVMTKDELAAPTMTILKRVIDTMWNAFGVAASPSYDRVGNWIASHA